MEQLIKEQPASGELIGKTFTNYNKDGPKRKTKVYLETRLARLDFEWSQFESRDIKLQQFKTEKPDHSYFAKGYHQQVEDLVNNYRSKLVEALSILEAANADSPTPQHMGQAIEVQQRLIRKQTAAISHLNHLLESTTMTMTDQSRAYYAQKFASINDLWSIISNRHFEIIAEDNTLDYCAEEIQPLQERCHTVLITLQEQMDKFTPTLLPTASTSNPTSGTPHLKLPKIILPSFDGSYLKWTEFHDLFLQLIHQQSLSQSEKMFYLKAHLTGEASKLIQHLQVSEDNYGSAWSILVNRYNNKRLLLSALLNKLLGQPVINSDSHVSLKRLHDITNECLLGISNLGVPTAEWDPLLLHFLLQKLDKESHRLYEQSLTSSKDLQPVKGLLTFLESRFQMLETLGGVKERGEQRKHGPQKVSLVTSSTSNRCPVCKLPSHPIYNCSKFLQQSVNDRFKTIRDLQRCINCLGAGHILQNCKSRHCGKCNAFHNTLLHSVVSRPPLKGPKDIVPAAHTPTDRSSTTLTAQTIKPTSGYVFLATAVVNIVDQHHCLIRARAVLDTGSQINFISERLMRKLQLPSTVELLQISSIGDNTVKLHNRVNLCMHSRTTGYSVRLEAFILPRITSSQPSQLINTQDWNIPKNIRLSDAKFDQPQEVDLLIGAELFPELLAIGQIKLGRNLPRLQNTTLGWVVMGKCRENSQHTPFCGIGVDNSTLETQLQRFWAIEEVPENPFPCNQNFTIAERQCEEFFKATTKRTSSGRYIVGLPFAHDPVNLGDSKEIATRRFLSLERRLAKNLDIKQQYINFMREYISLNHMDEVTTLSPDKPHYFLPHHCVLRPESSSTKLRVVFDGSSKTSTNVSLNDILHAGPALQNDLLSILLRFRVHKYVFSSDISKMYRQIIVDNDDRRFQMILWRESAEEPLKTYQLNTVTYGTKSAPYLALRCLQDLAEIEQNFQLGAQVINRDIYVDDILTGSNDLQEAIKMRDEVISVLKQGQFPLKKWCANSPKLLIGIPKEDCETETVIAGEHENPVKTLGLTWLPASDQLMIKTNWQSIHKVTKRSILSDTAHIFDPLGIISPVVTLAKIFLQELWALKLDWDASLPMEMHTKWMTFREELQKLNELRIPRHMILPSAINIQLHAFSDASERAYGAVIYLRSTNSQGVVNINLVCAKSKVAPKKILTVPRLELCAAKLMTELVQFVHNCLSIKIHETTYWTDSQIVLAWLHTQSTLQTFVANRIASIQDKTDVSQWRFVNSELNPADILSRGASPQQLIDSTTWFTGPIFLQRPKSKWPTQPAAVQQRDLTEIKIMKTVLAAGHQDSHFLETINHRNSFPLLQRVTAYILRFVSNLKRAKTYRLNSTTLSPQELKAALMVLIKHAQSTDFADEVKSLKTCGKVSSKNRLSSLSPFIDDTGVLRVGGRLEASSLPNEAKHQIILSSSHAYTKMLMTHLHSEHLHVGPQALLAITRQTYWPLRGKQLAQTIVHHCIKCFKAKPRSIEQIMGNLPAERVQPSRPFLNVGVDFFGPVYIRYHIRGKQPTKAYVSVFICFTTKAVHLELVTDLTTNAFIGALKRFVARRGCPAKILSDNATNFTGAKNELHELQAAFLAEDNQQKLSNHCAKKGIEWLPIPPRSPHFGGLWEAAVKSAKHHLRRVLDKSPLTQEEFCTVLCQVEAVLNSRPLTPLSSDPNDLQVLTPGHFLIGEPLTTLADPDAKSMNLTSLARWNLVTAIQREFWRRWSQEYLQELQNRYKWKYPREDIQPGTLVLLKEDNVPPLKWHMGRIVRTIPGEDQRVRVVDIKTATGEVRRSIYKVCPLPVEPNEEQEHVQVSKNLPTPENQGEAAPSSPSASQRIRKHKLQNNEETITRPKRTIKINPITTLFVGLLFLGTSWGQPTPNNPVEVLQFQENPGVYFEDLGQLDMITNEWTLVVYFNLSNYWIEHHGLISCVSKMKEECSTIKSRHNTLCEAIVVQLEQRLSEIENLNEILKTRHGNLHRRKRSPFDIIGTVANKLFGVLDQEYATYMEETIQKISNNEEHLLKLSQNQTSIIESTVNILNKSTTAINQQFQIFQQQLARMHTTVNDINKLVNETEVFTILAVYTSLLLASFQRTQLAILEVITDTHQGRINSLLLSPQQLLAELSTIRKHLPSTLNLPGQSEDDLPTIYELLRVKARVTEANVLFSIKLPLLNNQIFQLFKLIPLPTKFNNSFVFIQPSTQYIAISPYRDQYFPLSQEEIRSCMLIEDRKYLCKQRHPIFNTHSTENQCEIQLLNHKHKLSPHCVLKTTDIRKIWIQLHHPNHWIFAFEHEETFSIVCGTKIVNTKLNKVGVLKLNQNCAIKQPTMTINAHNFYKTRSALAFVPAVNLSSLINQLSSKSLESPKVTDFIIRGEEDLTSLTKSITDLKQQEQLPQKITPHDVHQYSIGYLALGILLTILMVKGLKYLTIRKARRQPKPSTQESEFELPDLNAGEDVHN